MQQDIRIGEINNALLNTVIETVDSLSDSDNLHLVIDSQGGDLDCGFRIYQKLRSKPLNISALVDGMCASAAILPLLAVPLENREATKTSQFLIHSPITNPGDINLEGATRLANDLQTANDELVKIYKERTLMHEDVISDYMRNQKWFYADSAQIFGFIGHVSKMYNKAEKEKTENSKISDINIKIKTFSNKMNLVQKIVRQLFNDIQSVTCQDGTQFEVSSLEIGGVANVGDGTYVLEDGTVLTVNAGVITDIIPGDKKEEPAEPVAEPAVEIVADASTGEEPKAEEPVETPVEPEKDEKDAEIEELKRQLEEKDAEIEELKRQLEEKDGEITEKDAEIADKVSTIKNFTNRKDFSNNATTEKKVDYRKYWK